jgi:hypothetical protein
LIRKNCRRYNDRILTKGNQSTIMMIEKDVNHIIRGKGT